MTTPGSGNTALNEKTSETTLVPELKESSQSSDLLRGGESEKEKALLGEKASRSSIAVSENEEIAVAIEFESEMKISETISRRSGTSTLESDSGNHERNAENEGELKEPTSFPTGIRFALLTAAVCLTIGTVGDLNNL